jgi:hypothetical protein
VVQITKGCSALNEFERRLSEFPPWPEPPLTHRFTPGLYSREIFLAKGLQCTSKIHKTEHQFIVSRGVFEMWSQETGWVLVDASKKPYHGITKPGTRRAFNIIEDTYFTTFHPTELTDLNQIEAALIEPDERLARLKEDQKRRAIT